MISAGKMQNRCPGCRAQILSFYDALLLRHSRPTAHPFLQRPVQSAAAASTVTRPWRTNSVRRISTITPIRQEPTGKIVDAQLPSAGGQPTLEEIEIVVRQARQTFGNTLPADYLTPDELKVYERLYGPPLRETRPEDVGIPFPERDVEEQHALLRETPEGVLEEVKYTFDRATAIGSEEVQEQGSPEDVEETGTLETAYSVPPLTDTQIEYLNVSANNQREYEALVKLQRDFEAAATLQPAEEIQEEENIIEEDEPREEEEIDEDEGEPDATFLEDAEPRGSRLHEYTRMGQFKTNPSTLQLPKMTFVEPITTLLNRTDIAHITETAERVLGGPGLPYGPATPKSKSNLPQKGILLEAGHHRMSQIEADAYLATVLPGLYASVTSVLVEVRKRLGEKWLKDLITRPDGTGPRVLDVGAGGAGLVAWQDVLQAGWDVLREKGEVRGETPPGKKTVVVGSENLRQRVSRFLHNTTFLPRLPDYIHSIEGSERKLDSGGGPAPRKVFDVIIASHVLMPLEKEYKRKELLENLWSMLSPEGGVLIVLEKGHPRGFEAVASVRDRILDEFIIPPTPQPRAEEIQSDAERVREPGMIIAPCTNHTKCPMYLTPGLSQGRKDFCHFSQRFIRPPFLQKVLGASHHSHEDIKFSYLAVRRGAQPDASSTDALTFLQGSDATDKAFAGYEDSLGAPPHPLSLPRNILAPLKRRGHVTLDLCTPAGNIERWVVPKSFSKQAYHDARKAVWGDLWALGAKTRTVRRVRLGKGGVDPGDGGVRSREAAAANKKRPKVVNINVHPQYGVIGTTERHPGGYAPVERRTKGGKKVKIDDLLQKMGIDEVEDPEDKEDAEFMREDAKFMRTVR
ncbi:Rsm22-domain-containing protein [Parathielavia appendiculata]|uniref:Rsm22-domain-containing protein n=1 Tax=Parathielavia appendiculata TaxID=2587402 RepID=A0AAN6Z4D9_9PEZI|nr:Rsm22-domain-containing protein [Parathielavia appendiculata]